MPKVTIDNRIGDGAFGEEAEAGTDGGEMPVAGEAASDRC